MRNGFGGRAQIVAALCSLALFGACSSEEGENNSPTNNAQPDMSSNTTPGDMDPGDDGNNNNDPDMSQDMSGEDMDPMASVPDGDEVRAQEFFLFPMIPSNCAAPDSRYRMPFAIPTDQVRPAVMGDFVGGRKLLPNDSLDLSKIQAHRLRIAEVDYEVCQTDADCGVTGFRCLPAGRATSRRYCATSTGGVFLANSARQDYDPGIYDDSRQLVSVLIENTTSLDGRIPQEVGGLFGPDPEGGQELVKDLFAREERASDKGLTHRQAMQNFMINLASVADPTRTRVSLWSFAGDTGLGARPLTEKESMEDHFTTDLSIPSDLIDNDLNMPLPRTSNLYQSILALVEKDMSPAKFAEHEKFLFVFTDGYNEVYDEDATADRVVERLNELGVHLFIVHLDNAIDTSLLRDLPSYWGGNAACRQDMSCAGAPPCGSDSDCQHFETCRKAKIYPDAAMATVSETPVSYCMPEYNDGRLGPLDVYADMACRTGGNYVYISDPTQLNAPLRQLPFAIDGQWSVEVDFSSLAPEKMLPADFYYLSGVVVGGFGNGAYPAELVAPAPDDTIRPDTRQILRVGRPSN